MTLPGCDFLVLLAHMHAEAVAVASGCSSCQGPSQSHGRQSAIGVGQTSALGWWMDMMRVRLWFARTLRALIQKNAEAESRPATQQGEWGGGPRGEAYRTSHLAQLCARNAPGVSRDLMRARACQGLPQDMRHCKYGPACAAGGKLV